MGGHLPGTHIFCVASLGRVASGKGAWNLSVLCGQPGPSCLREGSKNGAPGPDPPVRQNHMGTLGSQQLLTGPKVGGHRLGRGGAVEGRFTHLVCEGHRQPCSLGSQKGRRRLAASVARSLHVSIAVCAGTTYRSVLLPDGPGREGTGSAAIQELLPATAVWLHCAAVMEKTVLLCCRSRRRRSWQHSGLPSSVHWPSATCNCSS